ncbi:Hypothetical protein ORPV_215 [Orpheovirus IHUMI-LCC2]|uniref:Uncharacterized protein n=1 Tax=Orpheovirus IHUMI-LCC2 TaxID=2023057 RepID=A0A2I2L3R9_9VIRU|nr:Hypothetical protein ORPV_215 [Orpheovirus IHUMI-LCC2]SNW62119.1 Hypothetical protein ORPV_215 [Orpheovirus IHUMI-LCC2]
MSYLDLLTSYWNGYVNGDDLYVKVLLNSINNGLCVEDKETYKESINFVLDSLNSIPNERIYLQSEVAHIGNIIGHQLWTLCNILLSRLQSLEMIKMEINKCPYSIKNRYKELLIEDDEGKVYKLLDEYKNEARRMMEITREKRDIICKFKDCYTPYINGLQDTKNVKWVIYYQGDVIEYNMNSNKNNNKINNIDNNDKKNKNINNDKANNNYVDNDENNSGILYQSILYVVTELNKNLLSSNITSILLNLDGVIKEVMSEEEKEEHKVLLKKLLNVLNEIEWKFPGFNSEPNLKLIKEKFISLV